jgi:hypothetical protein
MISFPWKGRQSPEYVYLLACGYYNFLPGSFTRAEGIFWSHRMKSFVRFGVALIFVMLWMQPQAYEATPSGQQPVTFQNLQNNNYLQAAGKVAKLAGAPGPGTVWEVAPIDDRKVVIRDASGGFLHVENGPLMIGAVSPDSPAVQWFLIDAGEGTVRLQNVARSGHYLHTQYGNPAVGVVEQDWLSARWSIRSPQAAAAPPARSAVTGSNLAAVSFPSGTFEMTADGWVERKADGQPAFSFEETGRDASSVSLLDRSRNVRLRLDLQRRQILYAAGTDPLRPLYEITGAQAASTPPAPPARPAVTGSNVAAVSFPNGAFEMTADGWVERKADGQPAFSFEETGRDASSVSLLDRSRNVRLRLDLERQQVLYAAGNDALRPLYRITSASATSTVGRNAGRSTSATGAQLAAGGVAEVTMTNDSGNPVLVLAVVSADEQEIVAELSAGQSVLQQAMPGQVFAFATADGANWVGEQYEVTGQARQSISLPYTQPRVSQKPKVGPAAPAGRNVVPTKLTDAQIEAVADELIRTIIQVQLDAQNRPKACWRDSYGRGAGKIPECSPDQERDGLLCYEPCSKHPKAERGQRYENVGGVCWQQCPKGFRNDGTFCRKAEYGRGVGYGFVPILENIDDALRRCRDGEWSKRHQDGNEWMQKVGKKKICEVNLLMAYPKCKPGFKPFGSNICVPKERDCKAAGLGGKVLGSCAKKTFVTWPVEGGCANPKTQENDAGLCYPKCRRGYKGVGPVCWAQCPSHMPVNCGASCAKDKSSCTLTVTDQVMAPVMAAGNAALTVATLGTATGATAAAKTGAAAAKVAASAAARSTAKAALKTGVKKAIQAKIKHYSKELAKDLAFDAAIGSVLTTSIWAGMNEGMKAQAKQAVGKKVRAELNARLADEAAIDAIVEATMKGVEEQQPGAEFPWESLDPTGVAEIVVAYNIPMCSSVH